VAHLVSPAERTAVTYRAEKWRAVFTGILETGQATFLLLIAVRWFHAGPTAKALLVAGQSIGLICGPLVVNLTQRFRWPVAHAAAGMVALGALGMGLALAVPQMHAFIAGSMLATFAMAAIVPLMTQVFHENYPAATRGSLFSRAFMVRIAFAVVFSQFGGWLLTGDIAQYRWLLAAFALSLGAVCYCLTRIPSDPLAASESSHPLRALRHVRDDRLFRQVLISWMLMGFGNLITLPLRIEYLANPVHGVSMTNGQIAFVTGVVPNLARLIVTPFCGMAFDRMNFFTMRAMLNPRVRRLDPRLLHQQHDARSHPRRDHLRNFGSRRRRGVVALGDEARALESRRRLHVDPRVADRRARNHRPARGLSRDHALLARDRRLVLRRAHPPRQRHAAPRNPRLTFPAARRRPDGRSARIAASSVQRSHSS
jgi:hypothetical protein